jgi:hypothetical protein
MLPVMAAALRISLYDDSPTLVPTTAIERNRTDSTGPTRSLKNFFSALSFAVLGTLPTKIVRASLVCAAVRAAALDLAEGLFLADAAATAAAAAFFSARRCWTSAEEAEALEAEAEEEEENREVEVWGQAGGSGCVRGRKGAGVCGEKPSVDGDACEKGGLCGMA